MSSLVIFPRFQEEAPMRAAVHDRTLIERSPERHWLDDAEVAVLTAPNFADGLDVVEERRKEYWGIYAIAHVATTAAVRGADSDSYRLKVARHEFLWDQQAMQGRATEVVLEKSEDAINFSEVLALLIPSKKTRMQRIVLQDNEGWFYPGGSEDRRTARRYVETVGALARRDA